MFRSSKVTVLEWIILLVICSVPILNIIFVVFMFIRGKASPTIKNFFVAYLILWVLAFFGMFTGVFSNFQGLFS